MRYLAALSLAIRSLPHELRLGSVAVLGLTLALWWRHETVPELLFDQTTLNELLHHSGGILLFVGLLTACSLVYPWLLRQPVKLVGLRWVLFGSYLGIFYLLYSQLVTLLFGLPRSQYVAEMSLWYVALDTRLGVYDVLSAWIAFFLAEPWLGTLVSATYSYLVYIVLGGVLLVSFYSARLAREYLLAGFISLIIAVPVWLLFPGIAPYELAVTEAFSTLELDATITEATDPVRSLYDQFAGTRWAKTTAGWAQYWEDETQGLGHAISVNPSMHIIWGVLLTYYLWRATWWWGTLGLAVALLQAIGTMLYLQHYLIDLPVGLIFGGVAIWVARQLAKRECSSQQFREEFWFWPLLQSQQVGRWLQRRYRKWRSVDS